MVAKQLQATITVWNDYTGNPLYGHPLNTVSFVCPDKKLIYFL